MACLSLIGEIVIFSLFVILFVILRISLLVGLNRIIDLYEQMRYIILGIQKRNPKFQWIFYFVAVIIAFFLAQTIQVSLGTVYLCDCCCAAKSQN